MNERMGRQPEEWLRLAEEALDVGFWTWHAADNRLIASSGFFRLVGVNPAGVQLDPHFVESLVHPKDRIQLNDSHDLLTDSRQAERRFRIIRPDGQMRWLESRASSFFDRDGIVTRVVAVVADITDDHAQRRRLGNLQGLLHNLSRLMGAALWIADDDGKLIDRFSADESNKLMGSVGGPSNWRDIIHPDDLLRVPAAWKEAVSKRSMYRFSGRMLMADGKYRPLEAVGLPLDPEHSPDPYWAGFAASDTGALSSKMASGDPEAVLLSSGQVRACRALLNWTAEDLAAQAGISVSTIRRLEGNEATQGQGDSMRLVVLAFREAGLRIWKGEDGRFCLSDRS